MAFATNSEFSLGSFKAGMPLTTKILWSKNKTEKDRTDINMALRMRSNVESGPNSKISLICLACFPY